jgi:hypothetical protein
VKKKNWKLTAGIVLMMVSVPLFLSVFILPFIDIRRSVKITVSSVLLIIGEVLFWWGGLLVGKELFAKYRSYFNPKNWFKKKSAEEPEDPG